MVEDNTPTGLLLSYLEEGLIYRGNSIHNLETAASELGIRLPL